MLIDSNSKYIDCERFSPRTPTHQYFTPTITSATDLLTTNDLGNPSHIIIHTGTNDLEKLRTSQCISNYHELLKLVSEKHSSSKVIVSSLLIRADGTVCGPWSASFRKMIKYFVKKKSTLNNERYRDLLISILSYDEVSAFLLRVKT